MVKTTRQQRNSFCDVFCAITLNTRGIDEASVCFSLGAFKHHWTLYKHNALAPNSYGSIVGYAYATYYCAALFFILFIFHWFKLNEDKYTFKLSFIYKNTIK